jgi:hypothetical protein
MKVMIAIPAQEGRETRTYECVRGHSERINVGLHRLGAASAAASQVSTRDQRSSMKMIAVSRSRPRATIRLATNRADPLQPSVRDAMLAAVPSLRAFAISLSGNVGPPGREPCSPEGSQRRHHALDHGLIICSQTLSCRLNSFLWTLGVRPQWKKRRSSDFVVRWPQALLSTRRPGHESLGV